MDERDATDRLFDDAVDAARIEDATGSLALLVADYYHALMTAGLSATTAGRLTVGFQEALLKEAGQCPDARSRTGSSIIGSVKRALASHRRRG